MAGRYFGQDIAFLTKLRDKRQEQLLALDGKSSSVSAAGYSDSVTGFSLDELTSDLNELNYEIQRQKDVEAGTNTRPTCSFADFSGCE